MILDAPRCLDVTRLSKRTGSHLTGIDRVELAYLKKLLSVPSDLFGLVKTSAGYLLLDRVGLKIFETLIDTGDWGRADFLSTLLVRDPIRRKIESSLRKIAITRCRPKNLQNMLRQFLPHGVHYLNVGHSNLDQKVLSAIAAIPHSKSAVMIHDTIPLDHPEFQKVGSPAKFHAQLKASACLADYIVTVSHFSADRLKFHLGPMGRCPQIIPAHLGIANHHASDPDFKAPDTPYFVSIGTIEPRKNHQLLLDVWEVLSQQDNAPQLYICGARGWKNEGVFKRLDAKPKNVVECNTLSDSQITAFLQNAQGLLMPSFAEGFGLPAIEAAAINIPLVLSDLPPYREFLGDLPVYLDPNDKYQWINAIRALCEKGGQSDVPAFDPATWEAHFSKVLSRI